MFMKYNLPHTLKPWNTRANVGLQQDQNDATGYRCLFIYYLYWLLKLRLADASIQVIYDHRQTRNSCDIIHQPLRTILHQNDKSSFLQQALVVRHIFPALELLLWAKWSTSSKTTTLPVLVLDMVSMWLLTSASLVFVERLASCSSPAWAVATSPGRQPTWNVNLKELKQ